MRDRYGLFGCLMLAAFACSGGKSGSGSANRHPSSKAGGKGNTDGGASGTFGDPPGDSPGTSGHGGDPKTCDEAKQLKSYVGCDYWPTVLANPVWSVFDFAVVVANAGDDPADVEVTGPNGAHQTAAVAPNAIAKVYLPWVPALKGDDVDSCGTIPSAVSTTIAAKAAYHLVASRPVTVYQFNALEYKGTGGPAGKNWSACPGNNVCPSASKPIGCYSFSNDASLLFPSTAMTGNYRFTGAPGTALSILGVTAATVGGYVSITALEDGTDVTVRLSSIAHTVGGAGIPAGAPGQDLHFSLRTGDVARIIADPGESANDLSGSLVQANKPIQVITGVQCANYPATSSACDHVEESVLPAETLGKHYLVTVPTAPSGAPVGHMVWCGSTETRTGRRSPTRPRNLPAAPTRSRPVK